jgi:SAM-dependent methyltransferase
MNPATCPSCGSDRVVRRAELPSTSVSSCLQCDLCFGSSAIESGSQNPIQTEEAFYDGIMGAFLEQQAQAREIVPKRLAAYQHWLGRRVSRLLEIGCATGAYASAYAELGVEYRGIEIDERLAEFARSNAKIDVLNANFFEVPDIGTFDVIFASQVLEHVQDPTSFLKHARRLAPSGLVHVDVPNQDSLISVVRKKTSRTEFGFIQPPHHMMAYNAAALSNLYSRSGLSPLLVRAFSNDDRLWGQLVSRPSLLHRLSYSVSNALGKGSLLVAIGAVAPE